MTQIVKKLKPLSVNTDTAKNDLKETESTFIRGYDIAFSKNGNSNEGGNFGVGKKMPSNFQTIPIILPAGQNKTIGFYESEELNEAYVLNWNSNNQHGVYRLDGVTLTADTVAIKPGFNFSIDPRYAIPDHRATLRVVYGLNDAGERVPIEKYFIFTDGNNWQRWISVIAAIATNGFDAIKFPYYKLQPPHYDENELIDYVVRPSMIAPTVTPIQPTPADIGLQNHLLKQSIQFAYRDILTDGRPTNISWFSTPYFSQPSTCDVNNISQPRCLNLAMDAGSPLVEQRQILVRYNGISNTDGIGVNTDWALYDTIYKFSTDGQNALEKIGSSYWKRVNPWGPYSYDPVNNIINYKFCGDKGTTIFSADDATMVQNDVPLKSCALSNTGDVIIWCNNLRFYPNLPQTTLDNISLDVVDVQSNPGSCSAKIVHLTLYATFDGAVVSFKNGATATNRYFCRGKIKTSSAAVRFDLKAATDYGLTTNTNDGLICYLAGTSYYSIGKQYKVDSSGNKTELDVVDNTNNEQASSIYQLYKNGGYVLQQFDFYVPQGKYIARLARHDASLSSDYQLTSTYVRGIAKNDQIMHSPLNGFSPVKEILLDGTNGDVDTWNTTKEIFYLFCPFTPYANGEDDYFIFPFLHINYSQSWRNIEGYLRDNIDGINGVDPTTTIGVELVQYYPQYGKNAYKVGGQYTDANGFFFVFTADDNDLLDIGNIARSSEVFFDAKFNCGTYMRQAFRTQINQQKKSGYYPNQIINIGDINSSQGNYIVVTGKVLNCLTNNGISNVALTPTQGRTFYTDADGVYSVRIHTYNRENRIENIYVNGNGNCQFAECDCSGIPTIPFNSSTIACATIERIQPALSNILLKVISINGSSLKGGGRYPVGVLTHDLGGRKAAPSLIGYLDVPTFLEKGNFNPARARITINGPLKLPDHAKWLTFVIGRNLNASTYIQWVGDKIEFLDNQGNVVADGNGAIRARITIQSLLDFNILENFATTATYQFVKGDSLRIYDDGRGNMFTPAANKGYLDYQVLGTNFNQTIDPSTIVTTTVAGASTTISTANNKFDPKSFIIAFDERLLALKDKCGFWLEISRSIPVIDNEPFFGVSGTYPVINGEIAPKSIVLDSFDTYYQQRSIIISGCSSANFNHPFESQSITDYWGNNVANWGMVLFKDPLAQQRWYLNDVIKTDAFVNNGRVNGLGVCRSENRKDFGDQDWGGIIAAHSERNILAFICQNDWFTADFRLNYAHVDQYGRVIANPDLATGIGNPYQKVGDNFGCEYEDISTIKFKDGIAVWADRKNSGFIIMNYSKAYDISMIENKGYFIEKFKYLMRHNTQVNNDLMNIMETCVGINPNNDQIYITFRPRNGLSPSPVNFINNERERFYELAETFIYDRNLKKWVGWAPFAPEYYGSMAHAESGNEFITFVNGSPWFHNSKNVNSFGKFYGVDTDQVFNCVLNFDQSKLKIFQAIAIESPEVKYFISRISTDEPRVFSYIPLRYFIKRGNVYYAELLRDMNTYPDPSNPVVSMLVDGKSLNGEYAEFQVVADPAESEKYSEVNNILVRFIGSEKSE